MNKRNAKKILAAVSALMIAAGASFMPAVSQMKVSADQILGETSFDYKAFPWHTCESSPAKQNFEVTKDGTFHILIIKAQGAEQEKWDLQFKHQKLNLKKGHEYTISFKVKASRPGMELFSSIGNIKGDEEYCTLFGEDGKMGNGPHMGGQWGTPLKLTTEWQEITGKFTAERDLEGCEWAFQYANGLTYGGNAQDGDELWFDDMSLVCETCDQTSEYDTLGYVGRGFSGIDNNYISVNQLGYYSGLKKTAVLGDNSGDIIHGSKSIKLTESSYKFEVADAETDKVVYTGTSGNVFEDKDSKDSVCKLDFSELNTPGTYYIRVGEWRSPEFKIGDDIYSTSMLTDSLNYFYQSRSGIDIESKYITSGKPEELAKNGSHDTDTAFVQKVWKNEYTSKDASSSEYASSKITASGGWYDADNHGKYVTGSGIALWTLQNMYELTALEEIEKFADGSGTVVVPEAGNKIPDILDEAAYELDWMSQMVVKEDEPTWGEYAGMVYHKLQDYKLEGIAKIPWDYECEDEPRIVKPPTFSATLNYAACAAQAARLWKPYNEKKAAEYLNEAKKAYEAYEKNYYVADLSEVRHPDLDTVCAAEEINPKSLYAPVFHEKSGGAYGDYFVDDEAYWAACEIYISAKNMNDSDAEKYYDRLSEYDGAFEVKSRLDAVRSHSSDKDGAFTAFDYRNMAAAGSLSLALHKEYISQSQALKLSKSIMASADEYIETEDKQGYGIPYRYDENRFYSPNSFDPQIIIDGYEHDSNEKVINNALIMSYAYIQTRDVKYLDGVSDAMNYLLGTNPLSVSYITGYGSYSVKNPRHTFWCRELENIFPSAPSGVLSGGPGAELADPYVRGLGFVPGLKTNPSQRCYVDSVEAWSVNNSSLSLNASLAWVVSFLQNEAANSSSIIPNETTTTTEPVQTVTPLTGDINLDGTIDMSDLTELAVHLIGDKEISEQAKAMADVDSDNKITLADLSRIKQFISHIIEKF